MAAIGITPYPTARERRRANGIQQLLDEAKKLRPGFGSYVRNE